MATIQELFRQVTFEQVWAELAAGADGIDAYRDSFRSMFDELSTTEPEENTANMTVWLKMAGDPFAGFCFDEEETDEAEDGEPEEYLQVFAYIPGDPDSYAIGVKPPAQIAGLALADETVRGFSPAVIAAHILAEITYDSSMASSTWGTRLDQAGGGIYAAQSCVEGGLHGLSLEHLREQMGLGGEKEDLREKYGFLF